MFDFERVLIALVFFSSTAVGSRRSASTSTPDASTSASIRSIKHAHDLRINGRRRTFVFHDCSHRCPQEPNSRDNLIQVILKLCNVAQPTPRGLHFELRKLRS